MSIINNIVTSSNNISLGEEQRPEWRETIAIELYKSYFHPLHWNSSLEYLEQLHQETIYEDKWLQTYNETSSDTI